MRWREEGAQAVLDLRDIHVNGQWDAYWTYHRQQQHERLYQGKGFVAPQWDLMSDINPLDLAA